MTLITGLLGDSWQWLIGLLGILVALVVSYFGGKKVGNVQTQAKADVVAANKDAEQVKATAAQRVETNKVVTGVRKNVNDLPDDTVDQQLRERWTKD